MKYEKRQLKALFLDLDGTLLNQHLQISELDLSAVRKASECGVEVILASGRPGQSIQKTSEQLGIGKFVIASNGGCILDLEKDEIISYTPLPFEEVEKIAEIGKRSGVSVTVYTPTDWYSEQVDDNVALEINRAEIYPKVSNLENIHDPII